MHVTFARNAGHALLTAVRMLRKGPIEEVPCEIGKLEYRVFPFPTAFVIACPIERCIPWVWWNVDPLAGLIDGLRTLVAVSQGLSKISDCRELRVVEMTVDGNVSQSIGFKQSDRGLDMTVFDRGRTELGDLFGSVMCRLSMVHELMAFLQNLPMGMYTHICCDLVQQAESFPKLKNLQVKDPYEVGSFSVYPMLDGGDSSRFVSDAAMLIDEGPVMGIQNKFIKEVAAPIQLAYGHLYDGDRPQFSDALTCIAKCRAADWRVTCEEFIQRRLIQSHMDGQEAKIPSILN